jgi:hypothetical protein
MTLARSVLCGPSGRKPRTGPARILPDPVAASPGRGRRTGRPWAPDGHQAAQDAPMNTDRPDPNAELHHFEPLRVVLALGALLLALLLML